MAHNLRVHIELRRPDHLADEVWTAIERHNQRLETAISNADRPWVIGCAKELIESVARVVLDAKGIVLGSNADFDEVVNAAHTALQRQPGPDVGMSPEIRAIASSAKKIVLNVRDIRNDVGTGHGRARIDPINEEMATAVVDAAALWVRWALRRLGHVLLGEADNLIAELRQAIVTRASLTRHLDGAVLPDQPPEMQQALGVAFAQRAARGTFVAHEVGLDGPSTTEDLSTWPPAYRFGIVEGLVLSGDGFITLTEPWVSTIVSVLTPIPPAQVKEFLHGLNTKVADAGVSAGRSVEELWELARSVEHATEELPSQVQPEWTALAAMIDPTTEDE